MSGSPGIKDDLVNAGALWVDSAVVVWNVADLDQLQPVEGMGTVGEVRLVPDLDAVLSA